MPKKKSSAQSPSVGSDPKQRNRFDEIDCALAEIAARDAELALVSEAICDRPTPRIHCSFTALPNQEDGYLLFGGEYYDGRRVNVYGDLFRLKLSDENKTVWSKISSKGGPRPRSSHQAVCCGKLFCVFGGEFTTATESHFNHFNDLWTFELENVRWMNITSKCKGNSPCPRSGHRAAVWHSKIIIFGGFNDTGKGTRYFSDVYICDPVARSWERLAESGSSRWPAPRSGGGLTVLGDSAFVFGGYTKQCGAGKPSDADDSASKGRVHWDLWQLTLLTRAWAEVEMAGPPPPRAGFAMAGVGGSSFLIFGGVHDDYTPDSLVSDFLADAHLCRCGAGAWEPVALPEPAPQARMGACLLARPGGGLLLFGGKTDGDEREVTLDDLWALACPDAPPPPRAAAGAAGAPAAGGGDGAAPAPARAGARLLEGLSPACAAGFPDSDDGGATTTDGSGSGSGSGSDCDDNTLLAYRRGRTRGARRGRARLSSPTTSQEGWGDEDWPDPAGLSDGSSSSSDGGA